MIKQFVKSTVIFVQQKVNQFANSVYDSVTRFILRHPNQAVVIWTTILALQRHAAGKVITELTTTSSTTHDDSDGFPYKVFTVDSPIENCVLYAFYRKKFEIPDNCHGVMVADKKTNHSLSTAYFQLAEKKSDMAGSGLITKAYVTELIILLPRMIHKILRLALEKDMVPLSKNFTECLVEFPDMLIGHGGSCYRDTGFISSDCYQKSKFNDLSIALYVQSLNPDVCHQIPAWARKEILLAQEYNDYHNLRRTSKVNNALIGMGGIVAFDLALLGCYFFKNYHDHRHAMLQNEIQQNLAPDREGNRVLDRPMP